MFSRSSLSLLIAACLTVCPLSACKKKEKREQAPLSSGGQGLTAEEIEDEIQRGKEEVLRDRDEALGTLGDVDFDDDEEETEEAGGAAAGGAAATDESAAGDEAAAKRAAELKKIQDRKDTEAAVSRAIGSVMGQLRGCYDADTVGTSTISLRVHRMGYIIGSNIQGANSSTSTCIEQILSNLRVEGVKTDTITVKRSFQFKKY